MHLSSIWKALVSSIFLLTIKIALSQPDSSLKITDFRKNVVVYSDLGFNSAPFTISYPFSAEINKLTFKNNFRTFLGIGVAYKWFSLRLGFPILSSYRPVEKYGNTNQFNFGFDYSLFKTFCDLDFSYLEGYSIQKANRWDPSKNPNDIQSKLVSFNLALNGWYFHDKDFKMNALLGKRAHYTKEVKTWYLKGTINLFGIDNKENSVIPQQLIDLSNSKTKLTKINSFDFGIIPGYAYVNRIKNWQFCGWFGFGPVIQSKFYSYPGNNRGFLGIAPRYDLRLMGGYSLPKYFIFLITDFDNKSIRFSDLVIRQYFYSIKLVAGYRFNEKKKK
ncbi:MAG: DUF4421 domain-containing protein [Bacteroidetes bacterium]|nr:DUF4421 domain-containing protein [Bacteroidota bacterium]